MPTSVFLRELGILTAGEGVCFTPYSRANKVSAPFCSPDCSVNFQLCPRWQGQSQAEDNMEACVTDSGGRQALSISLCFPQQLNLPDEAWFRLMSRGTHTLRAPPPPAPHRQQGVEAETNSEMLALWPVVRPGEGCPGSPSGPPETAYQGWRWVLKLTLWLKI